MPEQYANNATTTLSGTMDGVTNPVTFNVADATAFPASGNFRVVIDSEILLVTSRSGNQFTATRAQEGSAIAAHSSGATVSQVLTRQALLELRLEHEAATNPHSDYVRKTGGAQQTIDLGLKLGGYSGGLAASTGLGVLGASEFTGNLDVGGTLKRGGLTVLDTAHITANAHHAQSHAIGGADHSGTLAHSVLSGLLNDEHTQYQKESEKSTIGGYATLVGQGSPAIAVVPATQLGTETPDITKFLRGDGSWQVPPSAVVRSPASLFIQRIGGTTTVYKYDGTILSSGSSNTTVFQAMLDESGNRGGLDCLVMPALNASGNVVAYKFTGKLTATDGTTLGSLMPANRDGGEVGTGMSRARLEDDTGWSGTTFIDAANATNFGLYGLDINFSAVSLSNALVHFDADGQMLEQCWLKGGKHCLKIGTTVGVHNGFVFGSRFESWQNAGSGIHIDGASDCMVLMNFIEGMPTDGVGIFLSGGGHLVENNHLTGHAGSGVGVLIESTGNTLIGSYLDSHGDHNIQINGGGKRNSIIGNRIYRNGNDAETVHIDGIRFADAADPFDSIMNVVVGNYFEKNRNTPFQRFSHCVHFVRQPTDDVIVYANTGDDTVTGNFFGFDAGQGSWGGGYNFPDDFVKNYTASNVTSDRSYDANATSVDELADVLGTLISDLRARGYVN